MGEDVRVSHSGRQSHGVMPLPLPPAKEDGESGSSRGEAHQFLARAAYAIRSPVNIILGYSELLAQRLSALGDDTQRPYLEGIRRSSKQILQAIERILDYTRIEHGVMPVAPEPVRLAELLQKLAQDYRVVAAAKKLGLVCEIEAPEAAVMCDSYCLTAALSNLIENAIAFTDQGGAVLKLKRDRDGCLCLEVRDTGAGFDPDAVLAEHRAGNARRYGHSGLGLILTRKYLDVIGASMTVASRPGHGSTFTIRFPAAIEAHCQASQAEEPLPAIDPGHHPGARVHVLVVEDQPDQALFMRHLLQRDYEVTVAANAAEALARLDDCPEPFKLILMDVSLGGGEDGLSLTRRIKAQRRWRDIPVVVASAHAFAEDRERALAAGCAAYLAKPINARELLATLQRVLNPTETR